MYDFPDLVFVTRHGCEPWADLAVKLMLKWPGLHFSTSAFAPRYYPKAVIDYANTRGADKVIYAGYFPMGLSLERIMTEMPDVPFKDEVWPKFLRRERPAGARDSTRDQGPGANGPMTTLRWPDDRSPRCCAWPLSAPGGPFETRGRRRPWDAGGGLHPSSPLVGDVLRRGAVTFGDRPYVIFPDRHSRSSR